MVIGLRTLHVTFEASAAAVALHPYPCLATRQIDHVAAQLATAAVLVQERGQSLEYIIPDPVHVAEHATPAAFFSTHGSANARAAAQVTQ